MRRRGLPAFAVALLCAGAAVAQAPADRAREAAAMLTAAGFEVRGARVLNGCGRPAQPRPTAVDLNGDGRPEAIVTDVDATCYGSSRTGEAFAVIQRQGPANWKLVGAGRGRIKVLETRTNGWRDYTLEGAGCQRVWNYSGEQGYVSAKPCPGESGYRPTGAAPAAPSPPPSGSPSDRAAAFRAAGFVATGGRFPACNRRQELSIEIRDLNGDGRPDAVITDFGTECYGHTGQGFVLVTKDANGAWRKLYGSQGIPEFQTTRGVAGWPDIENGGPGFCFPILRWNGSDYAFLRWKPYQPGACAGR